MNLPDPIEEWIELNLNQNRRTNHNQPVLVVILDGLDEIPSTARKQVLSAFNNLNLPLSIVLVTRPRVLQDNYGDFDVMNKDSTGIWEDENVTTVELDVNGRAVTSLDSPVDTAYRF